MNVADIENGEPATLNTMKILAVDDNLVVLRTLTIILEAAGYRVLTASSASEAFTLVRTEKPDLILLDLTFLPDPSNIGGSLQDGFLILDWLHHMNEANGTPVIIISGMEPEKYKAHADAAGILACLHKPINKDELLEAVYSASFQVGAAI